MEWDKLLKKTEVKLLGRASSSPFPPEWNCLQAALEKEMLCMYRLYHSKASDINGHDTLSSSITLTRHFELTTISL